MNRIINPALKKQYVEKFQLDQKLPTEILNILELQTFKIGEFVYHQEEDAHTF